MTKMTVEIEAAEGCQLDVEGIKDYLTKIFRMEGVDGVKILGNREGENE